MDLKSLFTSIAGAVRLIAGGLKKATSVDGIKETAEMFRAVLRLAAFMVFRFKDGFQMGDITAFTSKMSSDEEFKKLFEDAVDKANKIPAEVKDIDVGEGLELTAVALDEVPAFIDAVNTPTELKKEEAEKPAEE